MWCVEGWIRVRGGQLFSEWACMHAHVSGACARMGCAYACVCVCICIPSAPKAAAGRDVTSGPMLEARANRHECACVCACLCMRKLCRCACVFTFSTKSTADRDVASGVVATEIRGARHRSRNYCPQRCSTTQLCITIKQITVKEGINKEEKKSRVHMCCVCTRRNQVTHYTRRKWKKSVYACVQWRGKQRKSVSYACV